MQSIISRPQQRSIACADASNSDSRPAASPLVDPREGRSGAGGNRWRSCSWKVGTSPACLCCERYSPRKRLVGPMRKHGWLQLFQLPPRRAASDGSSRSRMHPQGYQGRTEYAGCRCVSARLAALALFVNKLTDHSAPCVRQVRAHRVRFIPAASPFCSPSVHVVFDKQKCPRA